MLNSKDIRNKISSIQNIQKIAKAMEMISASKMRKISHFMVNNSHYMKIINNVICNILSGNLEYKHTYITPRSIVKRIGYLIVSTDRGLVGGLNSNLFKVILLDIKKWNNLGIDVNLLLIGNKAVSFFNSLSKKVIIKITDVGDIPKLSSLLNLINFTLKLYNEFYLDKIFIVSNSFINILLQTPLISQILPIIPSNIKNINKLNKGWDYIYEPDSILLLNIILQRYIESQVYQKVIENSLSEQAARMIAMKGASDNGENIIKNLKIFYNKVRQNNITKELTEIVSGIFAI